MVPPRPARLATVSPARAAPADGGGMPPTQRSDRRFMLRIFLLQLFLFLLPFIGYGVYVWVTRGLAAAQKSYDTTRLVWLVLAGLACVVLGAEVLAAFGEQQSGAYVPLEYRDGQLVPGGFRGAD